MNEVFVFEFPPILSEEEKRRNVWHNAHVRVLEKAGDAYYAYQRDIYLGTELLKRLEQNIKARCIICKQEMEECFPPNAGLGYHSPCYVPWDWRDWAIGVLDGSF